MTIFADSAEKRFGAVRNVVVIVFLLISLEIARQPKTIGKMVATLILLAIAKTPTFHWLGSLPRMVAGARTPSLATASIKALPIAPVPSDRPRASSTVGMSRPHHRPV